MLQDCSLQGCCIPDKSMLEAAPLSPPTLSSLFPRPWAYILFSSDFILLKGNLSFCSYHGKQSIKLISISPSSQRSHLPVDESCLERFAGERQRSLVLQSDPRMLQAAAGSDARSPCTHRDCMLQAVTPATLCTQER